MGTPKEDIESAILYPIGSLIFFLLLWKCIISKLSYCLLGLPDRIINAAVVTMVHISSLQRMSPYEGEFIPTPWHIELALLFVASHYLGAAFAAESKWDMAFNLMLLISILDIVTLKTGGDLAIYILFLMETPDFFSLYLTPFVRSEACFEFVYTIVYVVFRIFLHAHITLLVIMNAHVSEDVKMNLSIVLLFSIACLPSMLVTCYQACASSLASMISMLPKVSRCGSSMEQSQFLATSRTTTRKRSRSRNHQ